MPRRLVTSEIFRNDKVAELDFVGRLFFIGLITNADDDGRIKGSVKYLKANIFPYDNITLEQIMEYKKQCHSLGIALSYNVNGVEVIILPSWTKHQTIRSDRYKPSTLPQPNGNLKATSGLPKGNQEVTSGMHKISKDKISKDKISKDKISKDSSNSNSNNINISKEIAEIATLYEAEIGDITSFIVEELNDVLKEYPAEQIKDAIKVAVGQNKRKWSYIRGILRNWKEHPAIRQDDSNKFIKGKFGHMVRR